MPLVDTTADAAAAAVRTDDVASTAADAVDAATADFDANATAKTAGGADTTAGGRERQRKLLTVGPTAVVVFGQIVGAPCLPYRPYRYAVSDVRVLINWADVDGRIDSGTGAQQVPDAPVQRIGQTAAHQMSLETLTHTFDSKLSGIRYSNHKIHR